MLKADLIAQRLEADDDPLVIIPRPSLTELRTSGDASVDLRLGTWFLTLRHTKLPYIEVGAPSTAPAPTDSGYEQTLSSSYYVPFGQEFILHPHTFVLGTTLEWIKLSSDLGAYVIGKSSLGRHGLIIATATGVHPGFSGCLTLEFRNVGEIPIGLKPGMKVCQLFLHKVESKSQEIGKSGFSGSRKPVVTKISLDKFAQKLSRKT